jgi:hypothetical protein
MDICTFGGALIHSADGSGALDLSIVAPALLVEHEIL